MYHFLRTVVLWGGGRPPLDPPSPTAFGICNTWECVIKNNGKIVLHLLFGWSLDKDQKSLDQSKQIYALAEFKLWNLFKLVDLASVYL